MAKEPKDIKYLPGWHWVAAGKEEWTDQRGLTSTERHAVAPDGTKWSVKRTQNLQKQRESEAGVIRPEPKQRTGRIRTIYGKTGGRVTEGRGAGRGDIILVYRTFAAAQNDVTLNPDQFRKFRFGLIQARYTERLSDATNPDSDQSPRNGYTTLTGYINITVPKGPHAGEDDVFITGASTTVENLGKGRTNPWREAEEKLENYDMTGDKARVMIYLKA